MCKARHQLLCRRETYCNQHFISRPAMVTAEPVYANNRPEHYAVSEKFPQPQSDTGAIAKTPRPLGPGLPDTPKATEMLLGAIGELAQQRLCLRQNTKN